MKKIVVSAPGKIHLLGEHSVVYGQPALIAAVDKRIYVSSSNQLLHTQQEKYIQQCLHEAFSFFGKSVPKHFSLSVHSDISIGAGMGSSAALAVAIAGFVCWTVLRRIDKEKINEIAFRCETYMHGNPSGGDNSASTYGGLLWYTKKDNGEKIIKPVESNISKEIRSKFSIINTGKPKQTTKDMVIYVKEKIKKDHKKFDYIFQKQGELVRELLKALEKGDSRSIKDVIKKGEANLESIGVVSSESQKIIREIERYKGVAKICGAGGLKGSTGILLVFHDNKKKFEEVYQLMRVKTEPIVLGGEGVRIEE